MITEDYVSFETAKLLNRKGFNEPTPYYYLSCKDTPKHNKDLHEFRNEDLRSACSAPTLQMAMKWLREVHNIFINITTRFSFNSDRDINFSYNCHKLVDTHNREFTVGDGEWLNYEEACEAAIKYCLETWI